MTKQHKRFIDMIASTALAILDAEIERARIAKTLIDEHNC